MSDNDMNGSNDEEANTLEEIMNETEIDEYRVQLIML